MIGCINNGLGLTSPNIRHEPEGPNSYHQEPGSSTPDCLTLRSNNTRPKSNHQEPRGSTPDNLILVIKRIFHIRTQNNITTPFINNTHETDITQKCNGLHQKYVDITKNM